MNKIVLAVILATYLLPVFAQEPLKATIDKTWTVDDARREAFKHAQAHLDTSNIDTIDPNLIEDKQLAARGGGKSGNRIVTIFNTHTYAVTETGSSEIYYYLDDGRVIMADIASLNDIINALSQVENPYPEVSYKYVIGNFFQSSGYQDGDLMGVSITTNPHNDFLFNRDGTLSAHWLGNQCFNANGSSCGTRKSFVMGAK